MKAKITVKLKDIVLDPQGNTILHSLNEMGYEKITNIRQGKVFFVELKENDKKKAKDLLKEIAHKVLSNPVIETYEVEIIE